ncbi:MAG: carbon-nitrogen hydrolase family protein [Pirellulales bacterium]
MMDFQIIASRRPHRSRRGAWTRSAVNWFVGVFVVAQIVAAIVAPIAAADDPPKPSSQRSPSGEFVVAAVTCEIKVRDTEHNLRQIAHWAEKAAAADADLVLFPECTIHGWWQSRENRKFAETLDGESLTKVREIARRNNLVLAVGLTEKHVVEAKAEVDAKADAQPGGQSKQPVEYHLTHALVGPNGLIGYHRKSALAGGKGGEVAVWDAGNDANVFDIDGVRVGIAICFESVAAETCRKLTTAGAELILAPYANGTRPAEILDPQHKQRRWVWDRVRENRVWYVACDATPHDKQGGLQSGAAYAIDAKGKLVACTAEDNAGEAMIVVRVPKNARR